MLRYLAYLTEIWRLARLILSYISPERIRHLAQEARDYKPGPDDLGDKLAAQLDRIADGLQRVKDATGAKP